MGRYLVFNIGCLSCGCCELGVPSAIVGFYDSKDEAQRIADHLHEVLYWREGGQNSFEVFDTLEPMADEYRDAISGLAK